MSTAYVKYPNLDAQRMAKLKSLENELGAVVVAVEPEAQVADLPPEKLQRLKDAEKDLGVILLAYRQVRT